MKLVEGTEIYAQWKEPTVPIYVNVYVWDLQNPDEVEMGAKPSLVQKGPYTYRFWYSTKLKREFMTLLEL